MQIRSERPEDTDAIFRTIKAAFANMPHSNGAEPRIVAGLRQAHALTMSLVAVCGDGEIAGHIAFSPVRIDRQPGHWYGLGPVSVVPHLQRQGIGTILIKEGLCRLRALPAEGCVVLGAADYYGRFGFRCDSALTFRGQSSAYFQRLMLTGHPMQGDVSYHPAFDAA